jgi:hypothetical protein
MGWGGVAGLGLRSFPAPPKPAPVIVDKSAALAILDMDGTA